MTEAPGTQTPTPTGAQQNPNAPITEAQAAQVHDIVRRMPITERLSRNEKIAIGGLGIFAIAAGAFAIAKAATGESTGEAVSTAGESVLEFVSFFR